MQFAAPPTMRLAGPLEPLPLRRSNLEKDWEGGWKMVRWLNVPTVAFGALLVSGCSTTAPSSPPPPPMRWTSNNQATQDQWLKDRSTCYLETQQQLTAAGADQSKIKPNDDLICRPFNACLAARGYTRSDSTGTLSIPWGALVQCAAPNT